MNSSLSVAFRAVLAGIVLSSGASRIHAQAPASPPSAQAPEKSPDKESAEKARLPRNPLRHYRQG